MAGMKETCATRVWPPPKSCEVGHGEVRLNSASRVVVKPEASRETGRIARGLAQDLSRKLGMLIPVIETAGTSQPGEIGLDCRLGLEGGHEAYHLRITDRVELLGGGEAGLFHATASLRQIIDHAVHRIPAGSVTLPALEIRDQPRLPIRGAHLYLPGYEEIEFFKSLVRLLAALKYNCIFLEVGAAMELKKHPEVNLAWEQFATAMRLRPERPKGPDKRFQDSTHHHVGKGGVVSQEVVRELAGYARQHHLEIVPEIQSLTHVYHLLAGRRELAELPDAEWPDAYCPSNEESYELLFEVMEEYLEVLQPRQVHIGHDEWRAAGLCPRCKNEDTAGLFARDVIKIHGYLREKGVEVSMWADHLLSDHTGEARKFFKEDEDMLVDFPTTWQAREHLPKDILMLNWGWSRSPNTDAELTNAGFKFIYGNFRAFAFEDFDQRARNPQVQGGEVSPWAADDPEFYAANGAFAELVAAAGSFWSEPTPNHDSLTMAALTRMEWVRSFFAPWNELDPRECRRTSQPIDLSCAANGPAEAGVEACDFERISEGMLSAAGVEWKIGGGERRFVVGQRLKEGPDDRAIIPVGHRFDALAFLHTASAPGKKLPGHRIMNAPSETAELLGWYEIRYEDGLRVPVEMRYGTNIVEWNGFRALDSLTIPTTADPVFFGNDPASARGLRVAVALEVRNPRPHLVIDSISLRGAIGETESRPVLLALTGLNFASTISRARSSDEEIQAVLG